MTIQQQNSVIDKIKEDHKEQVELLRQDLYAEHGSKNSRRWRAFKDPILLGSLLSMFTR